MTLTHSLRQWSRAADSRPVIAVALLMLLTVAVGLSVEQRYGSPNNLANVLEQSTALAIVALGQMLVVAAGGIDLSVGALIGLGAVLTSGLIQGDPSKVWLVSFGVVALTTLVGAVNGLVIVWSRVHPLVVTLGTAAIATAVAQLYSLGPAGSVPDGFSGIAYARVAGVPASTVAMLATYVAVGWWLRSSVAGRHIVAVGDDVRAARLIGLPVHRLTMATYAASGFFCGLASLYLVSRFGVGQPLTGAEYTLGSITPVVLGGTALGGGAVNVLGTCLAALLLSMLNNLLNFLDISTDYQYIVQGAVIIVAVTLYSKHEKGAA